MNNFARMLTLALACLSTGCDVMGDVISAAAGPRHHEDFHYTHALKPGGRLTVESFNGSVEIRGWNEDRVEIHGTKSAYGRAQLAEIRVTVTGDQNAVRIRASRPEKRSGFTGSGGVKFVLSVPRKTLLESVATSNGPVRVEDVEGNARVKTSNGPVKLVRVRGDAVLKTSNGPVDAADFSGSLIAETTNGPVRAEGVKGALEVTTSNGPVTVEADGGTGGRPVRVQTSNGPVRLTLARLDSDVYVRSSNGGIELRLPRGAGAAVRALTTNGRVDSGFDAAAAKKTKTALEGTIGGGGPVIELQTTNGGIKLVPSS
jgi:DUF4097 and DUF4098 domain-containing protein YvlB